MLDQEKLLWQVHILVATSTCPGTYHDRSLFARSEGNKILYEQGAPGPPRWAVLSVERLLIWHGSSVETSYLG